MLLGLVVAFAGYGLLTGRTWARVVAITLAALSAVANFLWLPYYPFWALLIISVDVFVIWAVAVHGREGGRSDVAGTAPPPTGTSSTPAPFKKPSTTCRRLGRPAQPPRG